MEAKEHLKIDGDDEDGTITSLIIQAREYCEGYQNRKYITQTIEAYLDKFHCGSIEFTNCSPVQTIESIKYIDSAGTETALNSSDYSLDDVSFVNKIDLAYGKTWPSVTLKPINCIKIRFTAGYPEKAYDQVYTGKELGTGNGIEQTFVVQNIKSVEKVYFDGVETSEYTVDLEVGTITCTVADGVIIMADYTLKIADLAGNVPESVKWAMVLHMKLLYDDYPPEERIRIEKARDSLLSMNRVIPV